MPVTSSDASQLHLLSQNPASLIAISTVITNRYFVWPSSLAVTPNFNIHNSIAQEFVCPRSASRLSELSSPVS